MKKIMTVISVLFVSLTVFAQDMERVSVETNSVAKKIFLGLPEVHQEMAKLSQEPAGPYHLVYITSKEDGHANLDPTTAIFQKHEVLIQNESEDRQCSFTVAVIWRKIGNQLSIEPGSTLVTAEMDCLNLN